MIECNIKEFESERSFLTYAETLIECFKSYERLVATDYFDFYAVSHEEETFHAIETEICTDGSSLLLLDGLIRTLSMDLTDDLTELLIVVLPRDMAESDNAFDTVDLYCRFLCNRPLQLVGIYIDSNLAPNRVRLYKIICGKRRQQVLQENNQ